MSSEQRNQLNNTENASGPSAIGQGKAAEDALLRQMNALGALPQQQQQQQAGQQPSSGNAAGSSSNNDGGVSFATVTYGDPLLREEREGSPDSLELQREQTFTAKDVGKRFSRDRQDDDKDLAESDDDQRRRSTDTLRRVEGALEQALESVEDTRALAFAQQFQRDVDSDEDSDDEEEADEDGYEEDEEDDNEPDYEQDGAEYNFQQVLDDMQASDPQLSGQGAFSSDFFDGPFDDGMGATPGALGPSALAGGDLSLYPNLDRSMAGSAQNAAQMTSSSAGFSHSAPLDGMQGTGDAAAAAGLMNQMWNAGVPLGLHQQSQTASGAGSMAYAGNANMFANVQSTGWGSSPGGHSSPINGLNAGLGDGSIRGSPGQGNASFNQQQ
uniref:Uncharacterized protein n=2 Tax=Kalmanozyma brasiliensis (strain GHG001) TaxID=1365824 RepID=V5ESB7_KALBG